jgi:hypothetical protein
VDRDGIGVAGSEIMGGSETNDSGSEAAGVGAGDGCLLLDGFAGAEATFFFAPGSNDFEPELA